MNQETILKVAANAPVATYGGAASTVMFWGLHISEICAIISTLVALLGLGLQVYIAMHRIRKLEKGQDIQKIAIKSVAQANRTLNEKVDTVAEKVDS